MPSVFLSYSSKDKAFVRRLAKRLSTGGAVVWIDEAMLSVGDSLVDRIADAIHDVDYVVAVMSTSSVGSRWVQKELSLALAGELAARTVRVLPVRLDDVVIPHALADKLYVDFSKPGSFSRGVSQLLGAMGIAHVSSDEARRSGLSVEWSEDGPALTGYRAHITPSESQALLARWFRLFDEIIPKEMVQRGPNDESAWGAARVRATIGACEETYCGTIFAEELRDLSTELGRKANLFYVFMETMHYESLR